MVSSEILIDWLSAIITYRLLVGGLVGIIAPFSNRIYAQTGSHAMVDWLISIRTPYVIHIRNYLSVLRTYYYVLRV